MNGYHFILYCYSTPDLRQSNVAEFVRLTGIGFGEDEWEDSVGRHLADRLSVEGSLMAMVSTVGRFGLTWVAKSKTLRPPIVLIIAVGGAKGTLSYFEADFSRRSEFPDDAFFRAAIERIGPYEASVSPEQNGEQLRALIRERGRGNRSSVKSICWLHYLSWELADQLGGEKVLLQMPAFRVERFYKGFLIQLTEKPLDPNNGADLAVQRAAMEYLGLISSENDQGGNGH